MELHKLFIIGCALSVTGCASEYTAVEDESYDYGGIVRHMHAHADQLDVINDALADNDLRATKSPARWLWRHDTMDGVPTDWQTYLSGMRDAARDIELAHDLETARAASKRVNEQCRACHTAAGVYIESE